MVLVPAIWINMLQSDWNWLHKDTYRGRYLTVCPAHLQILHVDTSKLRVSERAHVIMPYHIAIDTYEEAAKGDKKIGTTKNGIGPCYMDKYARTY